MRDPSGLHEGAVGVPGVATQSEAPPVGLLTQMPRPAARMLRKAIAPVVRLTAGAASSAGSVVSCINAPVASSTCQIS